MKKITLITLALIASQTIFSQNLSKDKEAIKSMCGCYEVKFNFAEVYSPDLGYDLKEPYSSQATEWITLVSEGDEEVSMQHILQVSEQMIIKHWRQDWKFEDTELMQYHNASTWKTRKISDEAAKGTWTQSVYQVDDSPRYEAFGEWKHQDGSSYWEGISDAPLPRRDLTTREDYTVMNRRNRHTVFGDMHLHEEDNKKINRSTKYGDEVIVVEKGYNTYVKVDDSKCEFAKAWWDKNEAFWQVVREEWALLITGKNEVKLDFENGKNAEFYKEMFGLGDKFIAEEKFNSKEAKTEISKLLTTYYITDKNVD